MAHFPASSLAAKLHAHRGTVRLYGTTPPRADASSADVADAAARLVERVRALPLDGFVVYDLQDESGRTDRPRPFPFVPKTDPRHCAGLLRRLSGHDAICFKCIGLLDEREWDAWLDETAIHYDIGLLSLVGRPVTRAAPYPMSLARAFQIAASHAGRFAPGGVTIAERHRNNGGEIRRMFDKQATGCGYFLSQTVYDAALAADVLNRYARECHRWRVTPCRVVLSFAPCGGPRTLSLMKWLGIAIPREVEDRILTAESPLSESIDICRSSLRQILDAIPENDLPLGFCVESLSADRGEVEASVELFHELNGIIVSGGRAASGSAVRTQRCGAGFIAHGSAGAAEAMDGRERPSTLSTERWDEPRPTGFQKQLCR